MSETTTPAVINLTPTIVKTKLEGALITIESGIQTLLDKEAALVYNEDHLQELADYISVVKAARKKVESERVEMKKPYKEKAEAVDDGAKLVDKELENILKRVGEKYTKMAQEQARKKKEQDDEDKRIKDIKDGIDNNIMTFSTKIAEAKDLPTLLDLERRLNLETANEKKYQEFLPELKQRAEAIRSLLSLQKQNVKQLGGLEKEAENASQNGADEKLEEIVGQIDEIKDKVSETSTRIQETALNQATSSVPERARQVFTTVKPSRTTVKWSVTDIEAFAKKHPDMVMLVPIEDKVKEYVAGRKEEISESNPEINIDGLKIYREAKYI